MTGYAHHRESESGLTLVEVMLVVFIVGLASSLVVMTIPRRQAPAQSVAQDFVQVLRDAQDQSILTGQPIGLQLNERDYTIVQWRRDRWRPVAPVRVVPRQMVIEREKLRSRTPTKLDEGWPDVVFDPSGIVEPVRFVVRARAARYDIEIAEDGEVRLAER